MATRCCSGKAFGRLSPASRFHSTVPNSRDPPACNVKCRPARGRARHEGRSGWGRSRGQGPPQRGPLCMDSASIRGLSRSPQRAARHCRCRTDGGHRPIPAVPRPARASSSRFAMRPAAGALRCCPSTVRLAPSAPDGQSRPSAPGGLSTLEAERAARRGRLSAQASAETPGEPSSSGAGADLWRCR